MIDHISLTVGDFARSKAFYEAALGAIGYCVLREFGGDVVGFGVPPKPDFWIRAGQSNTPPVHVAFGVDSREQVEAFYTAAMAAGGRDNGKPGLRSHYHPDYYGAFVLDPEGHNIEAVCRQSSDFPGEKE
ncbi:MAG: VOC family protein [Burkholderiales bacterium]|jgi:catechol 2,3-dioxygenase-like lactoylglutathione lyase family enzyme|nr:VOC family protein [Burkholderiales bacterium]